VGSDAVDAAEPVLPDHWCRLLEQELSDRLESGCYVGKTAWPAFPRFNPSTHVFAGDENGGR